MFLKRIEMYGFKSFADKVVINFDDAMTGIVGPNGCGKSNIADAVRWVLGEQSIKSLRGEKMTDVIFAGSENRRALNMAEVTLVFDNSQHILNSELEEIEITRRIYNTDQDAEYLINHKNVRLRDVIDLILDTGLGKDSLSMISQGNVSAFAEAKPYERRAIFEEAAGVAKYKKRKIESLNRLERTKENLERTFDILDELERRVSPLKRQAKKALEYREKKQRLEEIEIAVLVNSITNLNKQGEEVDKGRFDLESNIQLKQASINVQENEIGILKDNQHSIDREVNQTQDKLVAIINEIQHLETRKIEIDEKRKYAIENASNEEKAKQMGEALAEAQFEYEDRLKRQQDAQSELELLHKNLEECATKLLEISFKKEEDANNVRKTENKINLLENMLKDPFSSRSQSGVKTIMDNRQAFPDVMGVVGQVMEPHDDYEEAITAALAGSVYHIITKDEACARQTIEFLRNNRSGRATFLPLTVLRPHYVSHDHEAICENTEGFLGFANEFVECATEFELVREALLGNIIVCDNLSHANRLGNILKYAYNIVTVDGDIVHRGGTMTGGRVKNEMSLVGAQNELNRLKNDLVSIDAQAQLSSKEYQRLLNERDAIDNKITEKRIALAQLETVVDAKRSKYEKLQADYDLISPNHKDEELTFVDNLVKELNEHYASRDNLNNSLKAKRDERVKLASSIDRKDAQVRLMRRELDKLNTDFHNIISQEATIKAKLDENLNRLSSEYQMTYEYALANVNLDINENCRDEVIALRNEIRELGNVNMSAPEEFEEVNERYELLKKNYDDLIASRDKILKAIEEMDETMKERFSETFNKINEELPKTFTALFGGGKAKLVLEDPEDILNTGIDIDVQPPGKAVKSIRLFSGGEKTLIAICVLFTILKIKHIPLVIFDEVEAALDQSNVERFANYVKDFGDRSQFILITHRSGTMENCDVLYGVTMQSRGVSQMMKVKLIDAVKMSEVEKVDGSI